jgi:splicing factor 3B subunit 3
LYAPVRFTIDGDLCERFGTLPAAKQRELADDLSRTPAEMVKKLEETRNMIL